MAIGLGTVARSGQAAALLVHPSQSRHLLRLPIASTYLPTLHRQLSAPQRHLNTSSFQAAQGPSLLGTGGSSGNSSPPSTYFQRPSLPANTVIRFVPQQTAWVVERMGKYHKILQPGLAILIPFLDRIAYVKSLKEAAMEIPSQSAITADNVTLELDGVLYTRVFDAYKARYATSNPSQPLREMALCSACLTLLLATASRTQSMPYLNSHKQPCAPRLAD